MYSNKKEELIIVYDDTCGFCSGAALFLMKRDKNSNFNIIGRSTEQASELIAKFDVSRSDSVILLENDKIYFKSEAVFYASRKLPFPWKLLSILRCLPRAFTDFVYDFVARNRKQLGGSNSCYMDIY